MLSLTSQIYDINGCLLINDEMSEPELMSARVSRTKTLDGEAVVLHSGVSEWDRTKKITATLTQTELDQLVSMFKNQTEINVSCQAGFFRGVIESVKVQSNVEFTLLLLPASPAYPVVGYFTATPSSTIYEPDVNVLSPDVELAWLFSGADYGTISTDNDMPAPGDVALTGTVTVNPSKTTIYTLTALNSGGTVNYAVTVNVVTAWNPEITYFQAQPAVIPLGGNGSTLSWGTTGVNYTCEIDNGIGPVDLTGSMFVNPTETTDYILTARTAGLGFVTSTVQVIVGS